MGMGGLWNGEIEEETARGNKGKGGSWTLKKKKKSLLPKGKNEWERGGERDLRQKKARKKLKELEPNIHKWGKN